MSPSAADPPGPSGPSGPPAPSGPSAPPGPSGPSGKLAAFAGLLKIEHTVFALPFAYAGALLAARGIPPWPVLAWITLAMVAARSTAMGLNRLIDRDLDAVNPRTAARHLPRGILSPREVLFFSVGSALVLGLSAWALNPLCLAFFPLAMFFLVAYSYTKRFTWACHFFLAAAQFFAPFGAWIAVTGRLSWPPVVLGLGMGLWVGSFDLLYALQDMEHDRRVGILSIPARFGPAAAVHLSRILHGISFLSLLLLYFWLGLGPWYLAGVLVTGVLLVWEHSLVSPADLSRLNTAFFTINGIIALVFFAFLGAGVFMGGLH